MKLTRLFLLLCILIKTSLSFANGVPPNDKTIFILHSYSQEYAWTNNEHKGFVTSLTDAHWTDKIIISVESLDTKRVKFDLRYKHFFYAYLKEKYTNYSPDLIFCTDDNALDFLLQFKSRLFGRTSVVFCGVNNLSVLQKLNRQEYTGVFEKKEFLPNLALIKKIIKNPVKLKILGDGSNTCKAIVNNIKKDIKGELTDSALDFLISTKLGDIVRELKSVKNGVLFLTTMGGLKNENGIVVPLDKAIRSIVETGHHTIISMEDVYLHEGVLGGYVTSGISQGKEAANLAIKIMMGKEINSIPVIDKSPNQYMFNYSELARLNFPLSKLPKGSIVHNRPVSFYEQNKKMIWSFLGAFIPLVIAFIGVTFGLINSHRAKKAIMESENKYRILFESSMDSIFIFDTDFNLIDCNPAALELFGFNLKSQFLTMTPIDLSPAYQPDGVSSLAKAKKMVQAAVKKNRHYFEWKHQKYNGQRFDANVLLSRLEIEGRTMIQATVRDISEQKSAQEMLIQSEKMMSVGGLAAGMAHEINNPLAGVIQSAQVVINRLSDKSLPANQKAAEAANISVDAIHKFMENRNIIVMLKNIMKSGIRIASIIENMLSFARKSDASFSTHDPITLIERTLELAATDYNLKKQYDFKNITIVKKYASNLPMIACESSKIQQVILNILTNGAHAMFKNLNVSKPKFILRLQHETDSDMLRIEIEDNGPGMNEETSKRIFEPFFTTKPVGEGTGLGLSVSYFIITENHKGTMSVSSESGKGTNFILRIPLKRTL